MIRLLPLLVVGAVVFVAQGAGGDLPAKDVATEAALPVGVWKVEFANGVVEECDIFQFDGGQVTVDEPQRRSRGTVVAKEGSFLLKFNDDRAERWTPVGARFVVEHWFPASQVPSGPPVLGIAERAQFSTEHRDVSMNLAVMLLMAAVAAPIDAAKEHQPYWAVHHEWQRIHQEADGTDSPAKAVLVVDPQAGEMRIERADQIQAPPAVNLPAGLSWSAYLITAHGLTEIPFPVRLTRPRTDITRELETEQVWIIGSAPDQSWQFSCSNSPAGHAFHIGSGSPISSISFTTSAPKPTPLQDPPHPSLVIFEHPGRIKWSETLRHRGVALNLVRTAAGP